MRAQSRLAGRAEKTTLRHVQLSFLGITLWKLVEIDHARTAVFTRAAECPYRDLHTGEVYLSERELQDAHARGARAGKSRIETRTKEVRPKIVYADPLTGIVRRLGRGRLLGHVRLWAIHADCALTQQFLKAAATNAQKGADASLRATANLLMRWIIRIHAYRHAHHGEPVTKLLLSGSLSPEALIDLYKLSVPKEEHWGFQEIVESLGLMRKGVADPQPLDRAALDTLARMTAHLQDVLDKMPSC